MKVSYDQLELFSDERGIVFEPLLPNEFYNKKNAHIVVSMPEVVRGNHYHIKGEETVAIMGPALVKFVEDDNIEDIEIANGQCYRFIFPPGVPHAIKNLSSEPNILMAFNTIKHDPNNPDTESVTLI